MKQGDIYLFYRIIIKVIIYNTMNTHCPEKQSVAFHTYKCSYTFAGVVQKVLVPLRYRYTIVQILIWGPFLWPQYAN